MNKLEDFTVGSEWVTGRGTKVIFSHGNLDVMWFTSEQEHPYMVNSEGFIGFEFAWEDFSPVVSEEKVSEPSLPKFKIGDKVIITSWDHAHIRTPQKGVIGKVNDDGYGIYIEEDHYGEAGLWWFRLGEFKLDEEEELAKKVSEGAKLVFTTNTPDVGEETKPDFEKWLNEKITNLVKLDVDAGKLIEVRRIYRLYLNID